MLLLRLDPRSAAPAYHQIRDQIVTLVDQGVLEPGDRLPPSRVLAESIGVHRSTVMRAYDEIRALGYLESRPGSYTTVRYRSRRPTAAAEEDPCTRTGLLDWGRIISQQALGAHEVAQARLESHSPNDLIDLERLAADPRLAPTRSLQRCVREALSSRTAEDGAAAAGAASLDYSDAAGLRPLREVIAGRLRAHGVGVSAGEILITSGAQQALDLTLRLLTRPGDRVVVEAPTYSLFHALIRLHGLRAVELPLSEQGLDLERLERLLGTTHPALLYTMPSFHNPTGVTTDQAHRERLLEICERFRLPVVEDAFEEEMKYFGKAVLPIKSMDHSGLVLYVGTFSKVVFPGLRVGWIAAPRQAVSVLTSIQRASCLAASTLTQAIAERLCTSGELEQYLRRAHRIYRRRMTVLLDCLERYLPSTTWWTRPTGGYTAWLESKEWSEGSLALSQRLSRAGVLVAPGDWFFCSPARQACLRVSIACADECEIEEGCRRLGAVLGRARGE